MFANIQSIIKIPWKNLLQQENRLAISGVHNLAVVSLFLDIKPVYLKYFAYYPCIFRGFCHIDDEIHSPANQLLLGANTSLFHQLLQTLQSRVDTEVRPSRRMRRSLFSFIIKLPSFPVPQGRKTRAEWLLQIKPY